MKFAVIKQSRTLVYKIDGDVSTEDARKCVLARIDAGMPLDLICDHLTTDSTELMDVMPEIEGVLSQDAAEVKATVVASPAPTLDGSGELTADDGLSA